MPIPSNNPFNDLRQWVDTQQEDFRNMSANDFAIVTQTIRNLFTAGNGVFNQDKSWDQVKCIWWYMGLSLFLRNENGVYAKDQKLSLLQGLDSVIVPIIGNALNRLNAKTPIWFQERRDRSFHQNLLHIHWNLIRYYQGANIAPDVFLTLPLGVEESLLAISKEKAKNEREEQRQYNGQSVENQNNKILRNFFVGTQISPLRDSGSTVHIDEDTGNELDFPLSTLSNRSSRLTVETDGPHHYIHGTHTIKHTLGKLAYSESGGQRLALDVNSEIVAKNHHHTVAKVYGELLKNQAVFDYLSVTKQLDDLKRNIRIFLQHIQYEYARAGMGDTKQTLKECFNQVLKVEAQLRDVTVLEELFEEVQKALNSAANEGTISFYASYKAIQDEIKHLEQRKAAIKLEIQSTSQSKMNIDERIKALSIEIQNQEERFQKLQATEEALKARKLDQQNGYKALSQQEQTQRKREFDEYIKRKNGEIANITEGLRELGTRIENLCEQNYNLTSTAKTYAENEKSLKRQICEIENEIASKEQAIQDLLKARLATDALMQLHSLSQESLSNVGLEYQAALQNEQRQAEIERRAREHQEAQARFAREQLAEVQRLERQGQHYPSYSPYPQYTPQYTDRNKERRQPDVRLENNGKVSRAGNSDYPRARIGSVV